MAGRERIGLSHHTAESANLLAYNKIILAHKTVALLKQRHNIGIKLKSDEHNYHSKQIGEQEAHKLRHADMLS